MSVQSRHTWQAEKYHSNSTVQQKAAHHLLDLLLIDQKASVLDIGCGDGKITASIAKSLTEGRVLGTDIAEEMIAFAKKTFLHDHPKNLDFMVLNAEDINYENAFDVAFSSFALQWVFRIEKVFRQVRKALKKDGKIGFTIPLSISAVIEESLAFLIKEKRWAPYFEHFTPNYYLRKASFFEELLETCHFKTTHFEVVEEKWIFPSRLAFEQYTLMWLPHLKMLPTHLQTPFFQEMVEKYLKSSPLLENGKVGFTFHRVDMIAYKQSNF